MDIEGIILKKLGKNKKIKAADIVKASGFSRAYINRFFQKLKNEGRIILLGRANKAYYVPADKKTVARARSLILSVRKILQNKNLSEDLVLDQIKRETGIFFNLPQNISNIIDYAFSEMLNNAIEHSKSLKIEIRAQRSAAGVVFEVRDWGVGIFNNIKKKRKLKNEFEAIQDLLKGKQTTSPREHTGEGIFFTSKAGNMLAIQSSRKKLIFNNILDDIFIKEAEKTIGTKVIFQIELKSKRNLAGIFKRYSDKAFSFAKTETKVFLYKIDTDFISRSQARRIVSGLDKFKNIVLDFKSVDTVGQAFADEIFRVWQRSHPDIKIEYRNANKNIEFMIKRAARPAS
ncbi:MAG: hypothetical protein A3H02_02905 [Candidatus Niyogibacteria bacterium RIFCSPLOWO2_12_FULL_41_13]|uniref:DUF4325 domain-containing protein n=2 Tax=Parcubacteria group TaxID=1794811 RepID=A0A1G1Z4I2_9BACT|nr:MAG: hypothetical protein A3F24_00850 [Candidatus Colwellbacteria bacterium RIFCSPHIGHO2_12_FULL_44_17]OGZ32028.1 MAG: hypothetical protein A3H02_02905 [Candidatus Niyogibacteria bacterium RIFCSPLOWO2_12_FULL_41_13]